MYKSVGGVSKGVEQAVKEKSGWKIGKKVKWKIRV